MPGLAPGRQALPRVAWRQERVAWAMLQRDSARGDPGRKAQGLAADIALRPMPHAACAGPPIT